MLDACKIAEISVSRLFNESSAVALSYGMFRKSELTSTPKNIIFVDFGHSKLSAYCASFTKEKCQILAESHARNVGCRNIVITKIIRTGSWLVTLAINSSSNSTVTL